MNIKIILGSSLLAAVAAVAVATGSAKAVACNSPFQTNWTQFARCAAPNQNLGSSQGLGTPGTSSAQVRARLDFAVPGGQADQVLAMGIRTNGQLAGTPPCSTTGAPGCILCRATDFDSSPGSFATSPSNVCQQAVKHVAVINF